MSSIFIVMKNFAFFQIREVSVLDKWKKSNTDFPIRCIDDEKLKITITISLTQTKEEKGRLLFQGGCFDFFKGLEVLLLHSSIIIISLMTIFGTSLKSKIIRL